MRSSVFNSDVTKLVLINLQDIHVRKEIRKEQTNVDSNTHENDDSANWEFSLDFRNKKVPSYIVTFAQVR